MTRLPPPNDPSPPNGTTAPSSSIPLRDPKPAPSSSTALSASALCHLVPSDTLIPPSTWIPPSSWTRTDTSRPSYSSLRSYINSTDACPVVTAGSAKREIPSPGVRGQRDAFHNPFPNFCHLPAVCSDVAGPSSNQHTTHGYFSPSYHQPNGAHISPSSSPPHSYGFRPRAGNSSGHAPDSTKDPRRDYEHAPLDLTVKRAQQEHPGTDSYAAPTHSTSLQNASMPSWYRSQIPRQTVSTQPHCPQNLSFGFQTPSRSFNDNIAPHMLSTKPHSQQHTSHGFHTNFRSSDSDAAPQMLSTNLHFQQRATHGFITNASSSKDDEVEKWKEDYRHLKSKYDHLYGLLEKQGVSLDKLPENVRNYGENDSAHTGAVHTLATTASSLSESAVYPYTDIINHPDIVQALSTRQLSFQHSSTGYRRYKPYRTSPVSASSTSQLPSPDTPEGINASQPRAYHAPTRVQDEQPVTQDPSQNDVYCGVNGLDHSQPATSSFSDYQYNSPSTSHYSSASSESQEDRSTGIESRSSAASRLTSPASSQTESVFLPSPDNLENAMSSQQQAQPEYISLKKKWRYSHMKESC